MNQLIEYTVKSNINCKEIFRFATTRPCLTGETLMFDTDGFINLYKVVEVGHYIKKRYDLPVESFECEETILYVKEI